MLNTNSGKGTGPSWRLVAIGLLTVIGVGFSVALAFLLPRQPAQLSGTDLGKAPAPSFQLQNTDGVPFALEDFRGKVLILTFLYTHCPDQCPLIADHLRVSAEQLGGSTDEVALVAISLDPANDTPDSVRSFMRKHRIDGWMNYLIGTEGELKPVWSSYYLYTGADAANPDVLAHSSRIVLIDRAGRQRVNLGPDFEPTDLVKDVRALLAE